MCTAAAKPRSVLSLRAEANRLRPLRCLPSRQSVDFRLGAPLGAATASTCTEEHHRKHEQAIGLPSVSHGNDGICNSRAVSYSSVSYRLTVPEELAVADEDTRNGHSLDFPQTRVRRGVNGRPWTRMHARVQQALRSSGILDTDSVLVAVSGGQDSVCLLQLLADLQPLFRWRLGVVHCDHGWRPDSAANAEFVRQLAEERLLLPCYMRAAAPGSVRSESSAREWRYAVFAEVAAAQGFSAVVTAHTASDRAETLMLNLLRGAGPDGLVALARDRVLTPEGREAAPAPVARSDSSSSSCSGDSSKARSSFSISNGRAGGVITNAQNGRREDGGRGVHGAGNPGNGPNKDRRQSPSSSPDAKGNGCSGDCGQNTGSCAEPGSVGSLPHTSNAVSSNSSMDIPNAWQVSGRYERGNESDASRDATQAASEAPRNASSNAANSCVTGLHGRRATRLVRPLLEFTREETQAFVSELQLPYFHDSTNDCNDLRRNLLRNEVLPLLRLRFNHRLDSALFRFMEVLQAETEYLEGVTEDSYRKVAVPVAVAGAGSVEDAAGLSGGSGGSSRSAACGEALLLEELRQLPVALQRRVVHKWLRACVARLGSTEAVSSGDAEDASDGTVVRNRCAEVGYEDVSRCLALLHAPNRTNSDALCGGLVASVRSGRLLARTPEEWAAHDEEQARLAKGRQHGQFPSSESYSVD